eukprot:TRINITY_DN36515_c0_g1_i1.p1 TRINITY_DN36515_c0_g1~~TRINITY_DN36515_c0_g1_i1.p1  ORF type:complete len:297 (+),score=24.24 TRINITY_DN36515_c0_g1_i1:215-1105(+)
MVLDCFPAGSEFTFPLCCNALFGPTGNQKCWAPPAYTFERCCRALAVFHAGIAMRESFGIHTNAFPSPFECADVFADVRNVTVCEEFINNASAMVTDECSWHLRLPHDIARYDAVGKLYVEVGLDDGTMMAEFAERFPQTMFFGYEPFSHLYHKAISRTSSCCANVQLFPYGLGANTTTAKVVGLGGVEETIEIRHAASVIAEILERTDTLAVDHVFLNCEGCEYEVLPALMQRPDFLKRIRTLTVSWHKAPWFFSSEGSRALARCTISRSLLSMGATLRRIVEKESVETWVIPLV